MTVLADDLFGMPLVMAEPDVAYARRTLTTAWEAQAGRGIGPFADDIQALRGWFDPRLRGQTLRTKLDDLAALETGPSRLPATVLLDCGEQRYLVTPEGRAWLDCVAGARDLGDGYVAFTPSQATELEHELLRAYREWSRHRILDVIEKRTGVGAPLLPPAAGIVLLLLVNRSLDKDTAIRRHRDPEVQRKIDDVVADILETFADTLAGPSARQRSREHFGLWGGYPLTEARRRLAGRLVLDTDGGTVYIAADSEADVADFIARDIARRRDADESRVAEAFDALVDAYRRRLPDLSSLGTGFERVGRTDALRERLLQAARKRQ